MSHELIMMLSEKRELMERLACLLEDEQRSIVNLDVAALDRMDIQKRNLVVELESIGNNSRQALRRAAQQLGLPADANLSAIIDRAEGGPREVLRELQERLMVAAANLQRAIGRNRDLLRGSLQMVGRSLEFFNNVLSRTGTYGQEGRLKADAGNVRLVSREI